MAALRPMNVTEFAQAFAKSRENVCADLHPPLLSRKKARYALKAFAAAGNSLPADAGSGSRSGPRGRILARPPAVVIDGVAGDVRVPLVHAAVAHWNQILAGIGSGFRLGSASTLFASSTAHFFPLSGEEKAKLLSMYPAKWKSQ